MWSSLTWLLAVIVAVPGQKLLKPTITENPKLPWNGMEIVTLNCSVRTKETLTPSQDKALKWSREGGLPDGYILTDGATWKDNGYRYELSLIFKPSRLDDNGRKLTCTANIGHGSGSTDFEPKFTLIVPQGVSTEPTTTTEDPQGSGGKKSLPAWQLVLFGVAIVMLVSFGTLFYFHQKKKKEQPQPVMAMGGLNTPMSIGPQSMSMHSSQQPQSGSFMMNIPGQQGSFLVMPVGSSVHSSVQRSTMGPQGLGSASTNSSFAFTSGQFGFASPGQNTGQFLPSENTESSRFTNQNNDVIPIKYVDW